MKLKKLLLVTAAATCLLATTRSEAATFTVNTTADGVDLVLGDGICEATNGEGDCTLRAAIQNANDLAGTDTIEFNISGSGSHTITVTSDLPTITNDLTINGASQPGFSGSPLIAIDGSDTFGTGLLMTSTTTVRSLNIRGFVGRSILISGGNNHTIQGCYLGTDITGTVASATDYGLHVQLSDGNTIGGPNPGDGNIISGNNFEGIVFVNSNDNTVQGNFIGTDAGHTLLIPNGTPANDNSGIYGTGNNNIIGGLIAGEGNYILGNNGDGIFWEGGVDNSIIGNVIAFNTERGVNIAFGSRNQIRQNSIYSNGDLGIDLGDNGITVNDFQDSDAGVNALQNFPLITSAQSDGCNNLSLQGALQSNINTNDYTIEFFSNSEADISGNGEGQTYLGEVLVNTSGAGVGGFQTQLSQQVPVGSFISATATSAILNTSELSTAVEVTLLDAPGEISLASDNASIDEGAGQVSITLNRACGNTEVSVDIAATDNTATASTDFEALSQTVTFALGETEKTVSIVILEDTEIESDETFVVTISNPIGGATLGGITESAVTITDNDTPVTGNTGGNTNGGTSDGAGSSGGCSLIR